jgi:hypothetical protein
VGRVEMEADLGVFAFRSITLPQLNDGEVCCLLSCILSYVVWLDVALTPNMCYDRIEYFNEPLALPHILVVVLILPTWRLTGIV